MSRRRSGIRGSRDCKIDPVKGGIKMEIQYITDKKGKKKNVVIPYKDWERLIKEMQKQRVLLGLKEAVSEVKAMLAGKKKMKTIDELINGL